jgi:aspartyl-tRNA(Asn)/glutamyl-tRNA(Gln) amidotransferase subunit A
VPAEDYTASLDQSVAGLRLAVPTNFFFESITAEARSAFDAAVDVLRHLGTTVEELHIPHGELAAVLPAVMLPEAYAYHAQDLAERPEKYPAQLRNRLKAGGLYLASEYVEAQRARRILQEAYHDVLRRYDLMLTPCQTGDAPRYEEMIAPGYQRGPSYTGAYNLTGLPSLAVPAGFSKRGLPLSIMLSGRPFDEATVLRVAHAYQGATTWHTRHPDV